LWLVKGGAGSFSARSSGLTILIDSAIPKGVSPIHLDWILAFNTLSSLFDLFLAKVHLAVGIDRKAFMSKITLFALAIGCAVLTSSPLYSQDSDAKRKMGVVAGPAKVQLKDVAQIEVPVGFSFLDGNSYRALKKKAGEPVYGNEMGLLASTNDDWAVIFRFTDSGFVKDDDKNNLNADKILDSIKRGTAEANKERAKNGLAILEVVGWEQPPRYDETTHNLEWCIRGTSDDHPILNYNTRLLGRKGYMSAVLIVDPEKFSATMPAYRNLLANYSFQTGQSYAEFRPGDKVAKYGLAALILTGGAVGAAKLGLFAWLAVFFKKGLKFIIIAVVAIIASIKKVLAKIFGRRQTSTLSIAVDLGFGLWG
jgi:uncharacterized membrane-anchored protein